MQTNQENWENFGGAHGQWRTCTTTKAFGELCVLVRSTSDRSAPTVRQKDAISIINDMPQSKHDEVLAIIADQYDETVEELDCVFDLAEIPLIDRAVNTYFYLECDAPDDEYRLTILFRDNEILGIVDRDAAAEIFEWDSVDEIEALPWDNEDFDDDED
ncbi:hypothetical protein [Rubinisphaera sp.]|uniref:hypothetical protein n=1 Tax=Rubinisphaera sp. TaxID=2024857 RepID=UPI000C0F15B3|nr:hypothetical protein [Rubinisphaera sp.]MBV10321.1 hypothetical protein [Rubinisphaera sp.]HCS54943.1 hypothetical protein [Planctomycetaceae bacterium]|tara:strand:- start:6574 stop:7050 length:477 start_codon:yes stop_codon:yes gene_type:complete